ncbi:response regulator [Cetobacterium sp. 2A]|uniref:ANTAR domain-containing response regulator n=1 Tax=unclassified Cetobacterium TaxID=2630983 RepID=UPI00163BF990|nr:response regulator [Cetobacterium sp. 2A]MBC2855062.1 response regulator [Cetobacterium sp. 2A]
MKRRIVIAEDETLTRMDLSEMLTFYGYNVVGEASDGFEALEICEKENPDIVLLDIKMPFMSGLQVAKVLKEKKFKGCIVMLTAYNIKDYIKEATEYSAMGYLLKPVEEGTFISHLQLIYSNFQEVINLREEARKAKEKLEERKKIEKAKGIIMSSKNMSENEAYELMRNISMIKRINMTKLSEIVILTGELIC